MTKGKETRLSNLIAKNKAGKLNDLETLFLNRLKAEQKSELKENERSRPQPRTRATPIKPL